MRISNKQESKKEAFIVEFRVNRSHPRTTFLKDCCRNTIKKMSHKRSEVVTSCLLHRSKFRVIFLPGELPYQCLKVKHVQLSKGRTRQLKSSSITHSLGEKRWIVVFLKCIRTRRTQTTRVAFNLILLSKPETYATFTFNL